MFNSTSRYSLRYLLGTMLLAVTLVLGACGGDEPAEDADAIVVPAAQTATPGAVTDTEAMTGTETMTSTEGEAEVVDVETITETQSITDTEVITEINVITDTEVTDIITETQVITTVAVSEDTEADQETETITETETMTDVADVEDVEATETATSTVALETGTFLTDQEGRALYLFLNDEPGVSNCYDQCAVRWPPVLVEDETTIDQSATAEGVDTAMLGTIERTDGTMQLTYNDWPLYYFADDTQEGDILGQGVGDVWYVVSTEGEPVGAE